MIRQRLDGPIYEAVFTLVLAALQAHGLLRGRNVGIDSSVMEANASLRGLVHRNTGEAYWDYVKRLAAESGIDPLGFSGESLRPAGVVVDHFDDGALDPADQDIGQVVVELFV